MVERAGVLQQDSIYAAMGRALRANVKSSMTHHSREQYVGPATTSSVWQPARKTGKQASDCSMLLWSMHALSCAVRGAYMISSRACARVIRGKRV